MDAARGRFVTGSYDQTVRLWDAAALAEPGTPRHRERVSALAPAPGGDLLLSGSHDGRVLRWDARTCAPRGEIGRHGHWVSGVVALPGGRAVSSGWDGTLRIWDLYRSEPIATIATGDDHIARLACTPDGGLAVTASTDSVIRVWDLASGDQRTSITAPDGRVVAVDVHGDVVRWVVESGRLFSWRPGSNESPAVHDLLGADGVPADAGWKVTACRIGAPGGTVLAGLSDGRILGAGTDGRTEIFAGDGCGPAAIACDPSGGLVLAAYGVPRAASDNTARLWTGRERESSAVLVGDLPWTAAAVAPDGRLLYLGDEAGAVHVVEPVPPGVNRPDRGPGSR
ncbi:hypothetical protein BJF79_04480 [Actinomadura sp. CNU-125]|uniref:WD40 repeat domain-containing protein n=1 Tax=Actinomadura sp. CNU-125 TaxID=1904961 RepID=UPI00095F3C8A|nr:WD40 repeat domain-containing protein [Actinomadura sp. CNU-125]OLT11154.1 hypothetical protein BJF79_04480 [Actinomadura sp. CNU-125]